MRDYQVVVVGAGPVGLGQAAAIVRRDDGDLARLDADMAQDERQHALADRAEADHHHAALEVDVLRTRETLRHFSAPCLTDWTGR